MPYLYSQIDKDNLKWFKKNGQHKTLKSIQLKTGKLRGLYPCTIEFLGNTKVVFLHTPGHTPGSLSIFCQCDGVKVLFGQDIHGPFKKEWGSDKKEWRRSLQRLLTLDADILCEGHFGIYQPAAQVRQYIESYL